MTRLPSPYLGGSPLLPPTAAPAANYGFTDVLGPGLGMMAQLGIPTLTGGNMMLGNFMGASNIYDMQRAEAFQRATWEAQQATAAAMGRETGASTSSLYRTFRGVAVATGMWSPEVAEFAQNFADVTSPGAVAAATFLGGMAPKLVDAFGMGAIPFAGNMMANMQSMIDPTTGRMGYSGQYVGALTNEINSMLYGSGADLAAMHGYGMASAGKFLGLGIQAGIAPELVGSALGIGGVERLRDGGGLSAASRRRFSGAELDELNAAAGSDELDAAMRHIDASRIAKFSKNMSGLMRAMEDIFGPGMAAEQAISIAHQLTQGGLSHMSLSRMEQTLRQMKAVGDMSGLGMQGMTQLEMVAASRAQQIGASQYVATEAAIGAGAFTAALRRHGGMNVTGMTLAEAGKMDAMLRVNAAHSAVGQQLAATARISRMGAIKHGTQAEAMAAAIASGEATYVWRGKTYSTYVSNSEWSRIMGSGTTLSTGELETIRSDREHNERLAAADHDVSRAARASQFDVAARPFFHGLIRSATHGKLSDEEIDNMINEEMLNFRGRPGESMADAEERLRQNIEKRLAAAGVRDARAVSLTIMARGSSFAARSGYTGMLGMMRMHSREELGEGNAIEARAQERAAFTSALSGVGRSGPVKRIIDMLSAIKPGDDVDKGELLKAVANMWTKDELDDATLGKARRQLQARMQSVINRMADPNKTPEEEARLREELDEMRREAEMLGKKRREAGLDTAEEQEKAKQEIEGAAAKSEESAKGSVAQGKHPGSGKLEITGTLKLLDDGESGEIVASGGGEGYGAEGVA